MARLRDSISKLLGPDDDHLLVAGLFLRLLALVYLAAFASAGVQITGLVGTQGILPLESFLAHVDQRLGAIAPLRVPTLFWIDHGDTALLLACWTGCALALLVLFRRWTTFSLVALYLLYLSVFHAGQEFFNFQWDYLLLETGFLAIFLSRGVSPLLVLLFHWLLFRLRFLSGISKLASDDPAWSGLSALQHYFETQPLPHMGAWYAHQFPEWLLRAGTGITLCVELLVPFFIFLPRPFRLFAALVTIAIQLAIIATSNHNFINILTILLCLFLLDDRLLRGWLPSRWFGRGAGGTHPAPAQRLGVVFATCLVIPTGLATALRVVLPAGQVPSQVALFDPVRNWGLGNAYHVFPTMQTERHELLIQGSLDGKTWRTYRFRHKPDDSRDIPRFIVPHQPRLDWMMWFVPTLHPAMRTWFENFLWRLRENSPAVTGLLELNPFPGAPPRYLRVGVERYRFTTPAERDATRRIWVVEHLGPFGQVPPRQP